MMTTTASATLALDDLMCRDDWPQLAEQLRDRMPAAHRDQLDTAAQQLQRAVETLAGTGQVRAGFVRPADVPAWCRLGLLDAVATWGPRAPADPGCSTRRTPESPRTTSRTGTARPSGSVGALPCPRAGAPHPTSHNRKAPADSSSRAT